MVAIFRLAQHAHQNILGVQILLRFLEFGFRPRDAWLIELVLFPSFHSWHLALRLSRSPEVFRTGKVVDLFFDVL